MAPVHGAQMAGELTRCDSRTSARDGTRGTIVTSGDAVSLAFILARALGITIEDD
jgi:signal transduction protein with GAF and PtsI domain